jgi:hypothetical protein
MNFHIDYSRSQRNPPAELLAVILDTYYKTITGDQIGLGLFLAEVREISPINVVVGGKDEALGENGIDRR